MRFNRYAYLLLAPFMLLAACEATDPTPYPYMPQFVAPSDVPPRLLAIPPIQGSIEYNNEINSILATQAKLTDTDKARILAEDHITPSMLVLPVIGADFTEEKFPALYNLLRHAASDAWRDADYTQEYWQRQRPWTVDERVQLLTNRITRPSYPSGHSTTNHVWAHILSDLFPEKQEALFAKAHEIGMDRVAAGVHFPSDIEAGKRYAAFIYDKMKKSPQYKTELAAAQAEVDAATKQALKPIIVLHPDPQPLPPSMVPAATPAPAEDDAATPLPATPVPAAPQPELGTPYPGKRALMEGVAPVAPAAAAPVAVTPPAVAPAPAPAAPISAAPAFKGNIPVDCMHPKPGELQTGCR